MTWAADGRACLSVRTCECLLQLLLAGGALQQPPDGHNHMLKGRPLAGLLTPALLQVCHTGDAGDMTVT